MKKTENKTVKNDSLPKAPDFKELYENEKSKRVEILADFQNFKKRVEEEKSNWTALANIGLITECLEIYDDIDRALEDPNLSLESAKQSLKSAKDKINSSITKSGVEIIPVKKGDIFNKETMEAISAIESGNSDDKNKVVAVISSAYKYKNSDFVIKPARVIIGK